MKTLAGSFDRFDIVEAYFVFAMDYQIDPCFNAKERDSHGRRETHKQDIHAQLDRMRFRPSPLLGDLSHLTENAQCFYFALCARFGYRLPEAAS